MFLEKVKEKLKLRKLVAIIIALVVVIQAVITVVVCESFLNTDSFSASEKAESIITKPLSTNEYISWLKGKSTEKTLSNGEGTAVEIKNNSTSHSYVIIFHSLTSKPEDTASYAKHFYDLGFNVLIPCYISETASMGIEEKNSVSAWVNAVAESDEKAKIYILGLGVGGVSAILATENNLPDNVKGIISDSAYSDINDMFKENFDNVYGFSSFPTIQLSALYIKLTRGWNFSKVDIISAARKSSVPILYIHGTEDSVVPVGQSNELYEVTRAKGTEHETIHGAGHLQGLNTDNEKYWRVVDEFIRNTID